MAYAQASDVSARLGRTLTTEEQAQVAALLDDVELLLKARITDLDDKVDADPEYLKKVVKVEATTVMRLIRNPDGYIGETDGNYSYQLNWRLNTGDLEITTKDWELLGVSSGIGVLDVRAKTPFERHATAMPAYGTTEWVVWNQSSDIFWNQVL